MKSRALKLMLLGEVGVGKTSLARRLVFGSFDSSYKATIGVDIFDFTLRPDVTGLDIEINLLIWDIDGDYAHDIYRHIYIEGASGALIVSDVTRPSSHTAAIELWTGFEREFPGRPAVLLMNKIDLTGHAGETAPANMGIQAIWTSAKTGHLVLEAFTQIARDCVERGVHL